MKRLTRHWVNQPSTLQVHHGLHGSNVLATEADEAGIVDVYFTQGEVISMRMTALCLSKGWTEPRTARTTLDSASIAAAILKAKPATHTMNPPSYVTGAEKACEKVAESAADSMDLQGEDRAAFLRACGVQS